MVLGSGYNGVWDLNSQSFLPDSGQRIWMDMVYWTQLDCIVVDHLMILMYKPIF